MNDEKDFEEALEEAGINATPEGDFTGEVWMSTDGKHTVHMKADNDKGRKAGGEWVIAVYDKIVTRFGTKQAQAKKEYSDKKEDPKSCNHENTVVLVSNTERNRGRKFEKCESCGAFLQWKN